MISASPDVKSGFTCYCRLTRCGFRERRSGTCHDGDFTFPLCCLKALRTRRMHLSYDLGSWRRLLFVSCSVLEFPLPLYPNKVLTASSLCMYLMMISKQDSEHQVPECYKEIWAWVCRSVGYHTGLWWIIRKVNAVASVLISHLITLPHLDQNHS